MKSLFLVAFCVTLCQSVPLVEKELFWYETEDGGMMPAFLKEKAGIAPNLVKKVEDEVNFWYHLTGEKEDRLISPNCKDNCLSKLTPGLPLVVVAHGFACDHTKGLGDNVRKGLKLRKFKANVILVDWSKPAAGPNYISAVSNVKPVGEYVATLINLLVTEGIANLDETYFVGHSLGAQMSNFVGNNLINGEKLKTIFGLDPAWPLFDKRDDSQRLDASDAQFVNVIHTSIGYLGFEVPIGHVDFYPNGGRRQPGCPRQILGFCSHNRVYKYMEESISRPGAFPACKCTDWKEFKKDRCTCEETSLMGWDTPTTTRGLFFLSTKGRRPYGRRADDESSEEADSDEQE